MHEQRDVVVIGVDDLSILVHAFDVAVRSGGDVLRAVAMSSAAARLAEPAMCAEHSAQRDESDQRGDEVGQYENRQLDFAGGIGNEML